MRVSYDDKLDVLYVTLRKAKIHRTVELGPALVDLNDEGEVIAFELLGASAVLERVIDLAKQPNLEGALADRLQQYAAVAQATLSQEHPASV